MDQERCKTASEFMRRFTAHVFENDVVVNTSINRSRHSVCDILDMQKSGVPIDVVFSLVTDIGALQHDVDNAAQLQQLESFGECVSHSSSRSSCAGSTPHSVSFKGLDDVETARVANLSIRNPGPCSLEDDITSPRKRVRCS
mmetsp:Transcript_7965/g.17097  ORF Transcript_7965/g.17097 Transcript_7965/m.17097 type:complete len:142 (+) Transcript_7965:176-601(+)|eukprot:CAMPEP_0185847804 /NCGR_PEP_ID=MMETSP1354-20130828/2930_1 /TAXON_ID=708628 /ORGANISM="Erythrolobus madagascarensis, Strain CCMP3276" /LENGTH=141 /DNA_ID=CAMNT_0028548135 /DNA_START=466 /DNA_END=891 /DNA_ORIENTATION=-